jgi:hypothetical protein
VENTIHDQSLIGQANRLQLQTGAGGLGQADGVGDEPQQRRVREQRARRVAHEAQPQPQLAQRRRQETDPEFSQKQLRFGLKSHSRLVDLIEAKDGDAAEAHWKEHMEAAGRVWLSQVGPASLVDLLD